MKRLLLTASLLAMPAGVCDAAEWICRREAGCVVEWVEGGQRHSDTLPIGSVVATEAGYIVNRANGWQPN